MEYEDIINQPTGKVTQMYELLKGAYADLEEKTEAECELTLLETILTIRRYREARDEQREVLIEQYGDDIGTFRSV